MGVEPFRLGFEIVTKYVLAPDLVNGNISDDGEGVAFKSLHPRLGVFGILPAWDVQFVDNPGGHSECRSNRLFY